MRVILAAAKVIHAAAMARIPQITEGNVNVRPASLNFVISLLQENKCARELLSQRLLDDARILTCPCFLSAPRRGATPRIK